jgi:Na+-transporting NADH:ubiquinone oxidoreductase subunit NqrD
MDLVNEVIERLLVTLDKIDKSLDSLVGIFLTNCIVVISALPMTLGEKIAYVPQLVLRS